MLRLGLALLFGTIAIWSLPYLHVVEWGDWQLLWVALYVATVANVGNVLGSWLSGWQ